MHNKAERLKKSKKPQVQIEEHLRHRLPSGQMLTDRFPILHEGEVPVYDLKAWRLSVFGAVAQPREFTMDELLALPRASVTCDIHCVTRWSKFDTAWEGVRFRDFAKLLGIDEQAKHVMLHADEDYETNVPLEDLMRDDVLLAFNYDGKPLTDKHGFPLRMIVPHLYFWKSAKWLRGIEFMIEDRPGFWERNGFHNTADPFLEQRFSGEALPIPEDEWTRKEFD
ncbi:sulfite oxidase-like oxidoreductase [Paenibacillus methanolicus]|uniref:DMSO/TMAO reductase YedYZ molybdopterin-dependent catalytic subunit n=1 Tax=Paenibacillus methanolicus TaxID=582686 RepID=A0A5S5CLA9_9BACL|nr:sulfite oxidase-like oxidoreductase [Paenibacillus methanolicus]TYP79495.1 DMSO/TMAO reductase YedYZ molybdopterin-dependent catalytic subunit [Paenibacillus methanolicus]